MYDSTNLTFLHMLFTYKHNKQMAILIYLPEVRTWYIFLSNLYLLILPNVSVTVIEVLPKEKKQKEEKTVLLGQCTVDMLPLVKGKAH